jgi:hypothetical protein
MAKILDAITPELASFIEEQTVFFVGTAPLSPSGHVNLSPKGLDTLRILAPDRVAYLDLTGSGNETSAHLAQNGRITLMFCAFQGPPSILRLYGRGATVLPADAAWDELRPLFPDYPGVRQIITVDVHRVQTSCGFAVPRMELVGDRDTLHRWARNKGEARLAEYRQEKNARSIDGLPAPLAAQGSLELGVGPHPLA